MFPGVILQMTYWYRPDEMSIRLLYFCELQALEQVAELETDHYWRCSRKSVWDLQRYSGLCF